LLDAAGKPCKRLDLLAERQSFSVVESINTTIKAVLRRVRVACGMKPCCS
jgi:hypothetical protein